LARRVKRFQRAITRLRMLRERSPDEILASDDLIDVLENNARIAIEALLDVARFVVSVLGLGRPETYREAAELLGSAKLLSDLAGLRNVAARRG